METIISYHGLELSLIELILGAVLFLLGILVTLAWPRKAEEMMQQRLSDMAEKQQDLQGRLSAFAESSAQRETLLRESLDCRLEQVSSKVGQSIGQAQEKSNQNLKQLHERLALIDRAQKNIEQLSGEVSGLQTVLSNKQARGAFGEKQMQDLITDYLPPHSYEFQATLSNGKRVDALIKLPNDQGHVAVDSKFPLESWRRLMEAEHTPEADMAARNFVKDVKYHIKSIADKYLIFGETHDIALMFLPSEAIYAELHANFNAVIEDGFAKKVMIVSPTTFMATLHTMRAVMKDAAMREQAHIIQKEVDLMARDVSLLDERIGKLQRHFQQSVEDMRQVRISTEKITKRADKIDALDFEDVAKPDNIAEFPGKRA